MESNIFMIKRKKTSENPESLQILENLDDTIESFLQLGKTKKAFESMNQALKIRSNIYGENSSEVIQYISVILKKTTYSCSTLIENEKTKTSIELLRNLLILSNSYPLSELAEETCNVYNTLACALRKCNKLKLAKKYAMKALMLANSFKNALKINSSIYLNLCAIFSCMGKHKQAAVYCSQAVELAQENLLNLKLNDPNDDYYSEITVLAVAYHNLAVEEEHLKHYESALSWYRKAIRFLEKNSSDRTLNMLEEFKKSFEEASQNCKKKFPKIKLEKTLKEEFFYESSDTEFEVKKQV